MARGNTIRGHLDRCYTDSDRLHVTGWVFHESEPLTHVSIVVNSAEVTVDLELRDDRPDVQQTFPQYQTAFRCSVKAAVLAPGLELEDSRTVISFVTKQGDKEMGSIDFLYFQPTLESREPPLPPLVLRRRGHGVVADVDFLQMGWRIYSDLRRHVGKYRRVEGFERILDWGCGCGRVSRHFLNAGLGSRLFGCDIDAEAIDWMKKTYSSSRFTHIQPLPPTPYESELFDLVYGISVFTHLDEPTQFRWLSELQRITLEDGIVAVSVLDEPLCPPELLPLVKLKGFFDERSEQSTEFAPFSNDDYYRKTYHSRAYVVDRWSRYFDILDYVQGGIASYQSLVIMRRPSQFGSVAIPSFETQLRTSILGRMSRSLLIFYCQASYKLRRLVWKARKKLERHRADG